LIGENGRKSENIPKVFHLNITINNIDWTIKLRDLELYMLTEAILANELLIKSNKILGQQKTIMLQEWCLNWKYERVIKNEFIYELKMKALPSKKGFLTYSNKERKDLANKKNFINVEIANIQVEVMILKEGPNWVLDNLYNLNLSNAENSLAPNVYISTIQSFVRYKLDSASSLKVVKYDV
jgi:hypothetical protein